ncbi:hypothetical protein Metlim_0153 [Methanoplanus limicola DSM 2279]|uniref:PAS/PAC sensor protein n=2 Tax=Methanoplanus limicola TaxID=2315 RepID=H1YZP4_9EURY|nr:hypothetical protein Metlim_0153 [Methanoplanus limicola DSM 2279]
MFIMMKIASFINYAKLEFMGKEHREFPKILEVLKDNPRGMSVKQISEAIGVNRISVGHYLEILLLLGEVDMETYGQAKVFFLSKRIPINAMMDLTSDAVLMLNEEKKIVSTNEKMSALLGIENNFQGIDAEKIIYEKLLIDISELIDSGIEGEKVSKEITISVSGEEQYFQMKIIPTVFSDGSSGITIIFVDITDYKKSLIALAESENKLLTLIQKLSDFLNYVDEYEKINADIRNPLQAIVGLTDLEGGKIANRVYDEALEIDKSLRELDIGWREAENIRDFIRKYVAINNILLNAA